MLKFFGMRIINLASGSDGNLTYLETDNIKLLVDIGLCCSEVVKRLALLNVCPEQIDAVLVSHEHSDHIKGADVFCSRYNKPIYAHYEVWKGLDEKLKKIPDSNKKMFEYESFLLKDLTIIPFSLPHDVPCFGFAFENNLKKVSILTDLGHTNDRILECVQGSQVVYIEANYDKEMLGKNEKYPLILKRRIAGKNGHLSNEDSACAIANLVYGGTRQVILSHLSKENNSPKTAFDTVVRELKKLGIVEGVHVRIDVATNLPGVIFKLV